MKKKEFIELFVNTVQYVESKLEKDPGYFPWEDDDCRKAFFEILASHLWYANKNRIDEGKMEQTGTM